MRRLRPDPDPAQRRRPRRADELPGRRGGQAAPGGRARRARLPGRRQARGPGERPGLRPALQRRGERHDRSRGRRDHHRPGRERRRRTARSVRGPSSPSPTAPCSGHFRHEVGHYYEWQLVRGDGPDRRAAASCSATRRWTTRPRSTGTTREGPPRGLGGHLHLALRDDAPASRTSPRAGRTTCTSATPSTPRGRSVWWVRRASSPSRPAGPRFLPRPGPRGVDSAVGGAEPDQPQHGQGGPLPVRHPGAGARQARLRRVAAAGPRPTTGLRGHLTKRRPLASTHR